MQSLQNQKFLVIIIAIVAVGIAVIVAAKTLSNTGKVETAVAQQDIQRAVQSGVSGQGGQAPALGGNAPKGVIGRLPGNKGAR